MEGLSRPDYEWSPEHMVYAEDYTYGVTRA